MTAIGLAAALVTLLVIRLPRTVPLSQCSEVYQRYHDTPGIQASFIKDKRINDTLHLDMTLLEADDSISFVNLLKSWNQTDEMIKVQMMVLTEVDDRSVKLIKKDHPELEFDTMNYENNELMAVFPVRRSVVVLHTKNEQQINILMHQNWKKTFTIH